MNSIERPCQTSAASQIVCSNFKNRIYTFKKKIIVKSKSERQRARDTHKNIKFSRTPEGWKNNVFEIFKFKNWIDKKVSGYILKICWRLKKTNFCLNLFSSILNFYKSYWSACHFINFSSFIQKFITFYNLAKKKNWEKLLQFFTFPTTKLKI